MKGIKRREEGFSTRKNKIEIVGREKYGDYSIYFYCRNFEGFSKVIIDVSLRLGMKEKDLDEVDFSMESKEGKFYYIYNDNYIINFFFGHRNTSIFIKSKDQEAKNQLVNILREHFEY